MTKLESWQIESSEKSHPYDAHIESVITQYITETVKDLMQSTPDLKYFSEWGKYLERVTNLGIWSDGPDAECNSRWNSQFQYVTALYYEIFSVYEKHSPPQHMADVYRSKLDQAIDYISGASVVCPLVSLDAEVHDIPEIQAATNILHRRKCWELKMTEVETLRVRGTKAILCAYDQIEVTKVGMDAVEQMHRLI